MRVLVTGGAGFIGSHLCERLVGDGHKVTVIDNLSNGHIENLKQVEKDVILMRKDILDLGPTELTAGKPEAVYHLACHPRSFSFNDPTRDARVNIESSVMILEACRMTGAKFIFSSNSGIYGDASIVPTPETYPVSDFKTPYDLGKFATEEFAKMYSRNYGLKYTIARFATVYGPRQRIDEERKWHPVVVQFLTSLMRGESPVIFWDGNQTRDFIYVADVVDALVNILTKTSTDNNVFNVSTGIETTMNRLFEVARKVVGSKIEPTRRGMALGDLRRSCYSNDKLRKATGWEPKVSLAEGVKSTYEYLASCAPM
jgi:UDP-glucose 4-epimerase